jgi:hypothetical protein
VGFAVDIRISTGRCICDVVTPLRRWWRCHGIESRTARTRIAQRHATQKLLLPFNVACIE